MMGMEYIPIQVCSSGEVVVCSGLHVVADVSVDVSSGLHVWISGQHVYVESGVYLASGINVIQESGAFVQISGQHVYVESGVHVQISGQHVYVESGLITGAESKIMLTDRSGSVVDILEKHNALVTADHAMEEVHQGEMYHFSHCHSGLATNNNCDILIMTASGYNVHTKFGTAAGGAYMTWLYENPICSNSGTPLVGCFGLQNMNRYMSGACNSLFSAAPTVTSNGCQLFCEVGGAPTGAGGRGGGAGQTRAETEWILTGASGPINYLFRTNNRDGTNAQDVSLQVEFSEETP